eukprot:s1296_g12.t1
MELVDQAVGIFGGNQRLLQAINGRGAFVAICAVKVHPGKRPDEPEMRLMSKLACRGDHFAARHGLQSVFWHAVANVLRRKRGRATEQERVGYATRPCALNCEGETVVEAWGNSLVTAARGGGSGVWNADRRIQGQLDIDINDTGMKQAQGVANALDQLGILRKIDAVASSDLQRASRTADIIAAACERSLPRSLDPQLREIGYGKLQGSQSDNEQRCSDAWRLWRWAALVGAGRREAASQWALPDFICQLQIAVGTAGLHLLAPHPSRYCRTLVANSRSQWALPGFIRDCQIPMGTAGLHPRAPDPSGHCRASVATARSQWVLPGFSREFQIAVGTAGL